LTETDERIFGKMKILAFDSTALTASVAVTEDEKLLAEYPAVRAVHEQLEYSTVISSEAQKKSFLNACGELGRSIVSGGWGNVEESLDNFSRALD
jgi:hypothetical protein